MLSNVRFEGFFLTYILCYREVKVFILGKRVGFAGVHTSQDLPGLFPPFWHPFCSKQNCSHVPHGVIGQQGGFQAQTGTGMEVGKKNKARS